jgi:hypothetical protein
MLANLLLMILSSHFQRKWAFSRQTKQGDVSKQNLIESPFTMLHPEGIRGIFNQKEIDEIFSITEKVLAA